MQHIAPNMLHFYSYVMLFLLNSLLVPNKSCLEKAMFKQQSSHGHGLLQLSELGSLCGTFS